MPAIDSYHASNGVNNGAYPGKSMSQYAVFKLLEVASMLCSSYAAMMDIASCLSLYDTLASKIAEKCTEKSVFDTSSTREWCKSR